MPIVGTVERSASDRRPRWSASRPEPRFPPAWRELLEDAIGAGLHVENSLHQFLRDDPELGELAVGTASSCATCAARRPT